MPVPNTLNGLAVRGALRLESAEGATTGGVLTATNPLDGTTRGIIGAGPRQGWYLGSQGPYHWENLLPLGFTMQHFVDDWSHKYTDTADDPHWTFATDSAYGETLYTASAGSKCLRLQTRALGSWCRMVRPGRVYQASGEWRFDIALSEGRDSGNTDPGNKTLAFGLSDTPDDPLASMAKTFTVYRTNADGTDFGSWTLRMQDGTTTTTATVSGKTPSYNGFTIFVLEYVPTLSADQMRLWIGDETNDFNPTTGASPDAVLTVSPSAFSASVRLIPFVLHRNEQSSGTAGYQYTTIKAVAGIRRHF